MHLFWVIGQIAESGEEMVRMAGLLRAVESASQAVSYGLASIDIFARQYGAVLNLAMVRSVLGLWPMSQTDCLHLQWAVSLLPAWLTLRRIGVDLDGEARECVESEREIQREGLTTKSASDA